MHKFRNFFVYTHKHTIILLFSFFFYSFIFFFVKSLSLSLCVARLNPNGFSRQMPFGFVFARLWWILWTIELNIFLLCHRPRGSIVIFFQSNRSKIIGYKNAKQEYSHETIVIPSYGTASDYSYNHNDSHIFVWVKAVPNIIVIIIIVVVIIFVSKPIPWYSFFNWYLWKFSE